MCSIFFGTVVQLRGTLYAVQKRGVSIHTSASCALVLSSDEKIYGAGCIGSRFFQIIRLGTDTDSKMQFYIDAATAPTAITADP